MTQVFQLKRLSEVSAEFVPAAGFRECRVIFKQSKEDKEAKRAKQDSQFCTLPVLSDSYMQSFMLHAEGRELLRGYLESLQDGVVRKIWVDSKRSPCEADFSIDALVEVGKATAGDGFRLSAKLIEDVFKSTWKNQIALGLALSRDAEFLVLADAEDSEEKGKKFAEYWASPAGEKFAAIAQNYLKFLVRAAARINTRACWESQEVKTKVADALEYCEDSPLLARVKEELAKTPIASVDADML